MQTLRKKNSPCKFKNEPTRFLGEGVSFKAKLIGILEVSEARGDRMCQAALADLKMAIRAAGEHKQRIAVQVSIEGLRLRDEKTGDCLYHHPVHKISFIAQDMSDSRAFGYIFGSPDTGHRFFGIKTDKAASQVVIAMRDLFQVVFELKKKEIEVAKQHIEQNTINAIKFHTGGIFVEPAPDTKGAAGGGCMLRRIRTINLEVEKPAAGKNESQSGVIADLLDLQFELNSLQQGIHQMDKITPENPPVPSTDDPFETDPFGDSFANMKVKETVRPILPPPPCASKRGHLERQQTVPAPPTSTTSSPATTLSSKTPPPQGAVHWFDKETEDLFNDGELANLAKKSPSKEESEDSSLTTTPRTVQAKSPQIDVFTELDPLGTGLIKPYVDKKDFFQHLKNPPKKVLKDLVSTNSTETFQTNFSVSADPLDPVKVPNDLCSLESDNFDDGNFANFDRFDEGESAQPLARPDSPNRNDSAPRSSHHQPLSVSLPPEEATIAKPPVVPVASGAATGAAGVSRADKESSESIQSLVKLPSPKKYLQSVRKREFDIDLPRGQSIEKPFPVDFSATTDSPASPLRSCSSDANSRLSSSSAELDLVPEPPPRGAGSILINPPPLPPKKQGGRGGVKPPPRPPYTEGHFHYDFLEREEASPSPTRTKERNRSPTRETRSQFDDNFSPPPHATGRGDLIGTITTSAFEDSFSSMVPTTNLSTFFTCTSSQAETKKAKPSLDITLSQLTSSNLDELANSLGMTVQELTSLTLQQLTECLASLSVKEAKVEREREKIAVGSKPRHVPVQAEAPCTVVEAAFASNEPLFKTNFDQEPKQDTTYDKYAVFRELLEMEQMKEETKSEELNEKEEQDEDEAVEPEADDAESQQEACDESAPESVASLVNLTVKLPPSNEDLMKEEHPCRTDETSDEPASFSPEGHREAENEDRDAEKETDFEPETVIEAEELTEQRVEDEPEERPPVIDVVEKIESLEKIGEFDESMDQIVVDANADETSGEKAEVKSTTSTSSDKYAALREIIGETEQPGRTSEEELATVQPSSRQASPVLQPAVTKSLAEVELLSLFSDTLPPPSSPKRSSKKDDDLKAVAMDIFEEIKMLNTGMPRSKDSKVSLTGFEDVFCPFAESRQEREDGKEDGNWAKFDAGVFASDKSPCEGPRSVGGTSPWSPDGKELHREASFKSGSQRHSGDSDNEWKDEEESEESNGRTRDGRFWCARHPRFDAPGFEERPFYDEPATPGDKRERSFRDRVGRKSRGGTPWSKGSGHRPRDPSPWHEEGQWEEEPRRYPHRKMPYKDDEDQYEAHWKCRQKPPPRWNWAHDHPQFYDDDRKRKLMLWNEEDRFGSEESMAYEDEDRWSRRKYERRRWEEDSRFWGRRGGPPDADYPVRDSYYYYRDSRERPHDYPTTWDEGYGPERPGDDSPRYTASGRKRHWPKRPNSANEGRNSDMAYADPRGKFGTSRSECSDNDSDPYLRPSQRSRSRESYWGSDQEYDSWTERPYWSEGPDSKSETLHRKRVARHKSRQAQTMTQSPFEDDFAQSIEHPDAGAGEQATSAEPRTRADVGEPKREPAPTSPSSRCPKDHPRRDYSWRSGCFEDDLTPTASASSDASDRQRPPSDLKATPEELPCDAKEPHQSIDGFPSEDSGRDSFFNGDLRFEDDAFAFKEEMEDNVPDHRSATLPLKNSRQTKYPAGGAVNNAKSRGDQYIRKSESVNIFVRESDPFDDDDFFN